MRIASLVCLALLGCNLTAAREGRACPQATGEAEPQLPGGEPRCEETPTLPPRGEDTAPYLAPPAVLQNYPSRVSSGGLLLLDPNGTLVKAPVRQRSKLELEATLKAGLAPRVGANIPIGGEPPALPGNMRAQAEPHLIRSPVNPDHLLATFQEGRFTTGGAVNCGYGLSTNGGISWTRALIPGLTTNTGGPYLRATDPVAGMDLNGYLYLNTLGALDATFDRSALVISRSTNAGISFEPPVEIARSPDATVFIDKNWMTVNTFSNTPTAGRIVSTFTRFETGGHPIALSYSDDQGQTWSAWRYATARSPFYAQGSQPLFLPSGKLAIIYWNFGWNTHPFESIEVVVSTNGGTGFSYSNRVAVVNRFNDPYARDGSFLPTAAANRSDESIYVAWQEARNGESRIAFTRSADAGQTWTVPVVITDNPPGSRVFNPAIAASADGRYLGVIFYDSRLNPYNPYLVDVFIAESLDGGNTWRPNVRLTSISTDMRTAPLTSDGYMLGDYQGLAAAEQPEVPAVALYIDSRTGSPDPFTTRVGATEGYAGWRAARFSVAEIQGGNTIPEGDPDGDGSPNSLEYAFGLDPNVKDGAAVQGRVELNNGGFLSVEHTRLGMPPDLRFGWLSSTNLLDWNETTPVLELRRPDANPWFEQVTSRFAATQDALFVRPRATIVEVPGLYHTLRTTASE